MSIKERYYIDRIESKVAQEIVIKNHYLHRKAPCSMAFGLKCKESGNIVGVIMYGVPSSRSLQVGVCGKEYANSVGELTRLWIDDKVGKNAESFLIGNTIKKQPFKIIVSYAECRANHIGTVYQATNWIYTGLSAKRPSYRIDGIEDSSHERHIFDKYGGIKNARKELGDRITTVERPRKHRYVYFNCGKKEKKHLLKTLNYKKTSYPKKKSLKELYEISEISKDKAQQMIVREHYLHRKAPCSQAFGLIDRETKDIKGVIMYGTPSSASLRKGICGEKHKDNVIELTRLWISDDVGKNAESYLIGNTLKKVSKEIIVSYAEDKQGHIGTVYQATNWIYTGMSAKHLDWKVKGMEHIHSTTLFDKYKTVENIKSTFGDMAYKEERPRKYRYVYFNCSKGRKKYLMKALRYKVLEYPKKEKESFTNTEEIKRKEDNNLQLKWCI